MEILGNITLNISLVIYLVCFVPQIIHNQIKHKTSEISLVTHYLMITANTMDLIYAVGLDMPWQYILVDVTLLFFLIIQQFQLLNDKTCFKIFAQTTQVMTFITAMVLLAFFEILSNKQLLLLGSISAVIYNLYWLPQIIKNFRNKNAEGFSVVYLSILLFTTVCDVVSGITLSWPIPSVLCSVALIFLIAIQICQFLIYKRGYSSKLQSRGES